jgi:hypothetical protein
MKHRVERLNKFLKETLSSWDAVECITTDPRSEIFTYDPYFALVIDVYHKGEIPPPQTRRNAFGDPGAFETATGRSKDRFFLEEIPIRIEYKELEAMERLVEKPLQHLKILKNSGTYTFYRLQNNKIIFDKSGWIAKARASLESFPPNAWEALRDSFSAKMEHYLSDMGAALFSDDRFFLLLSNAGLMRYAAASIFMANRQFEPSHRDIEEKLRALPCMPEEFWIAWETLLDPDREITAQRRFELARVMANAVFSVSCNF